MKDDDTVISEFNEYVNMTASELEEWLKTDDSSSAGWPKDREGGESVGQDSGHKIVEILRANPDKKADKYTDEQVQHMRKVASYCKRHLAQEAKGNKDKDPEEVKKTKSYISLKNWGHDFLKAQGKESGSSKSGHKSASNNKKEEEAKDNESAAEEKEGEEEEEEEEEEEPQEEEQTGDKRKRTGAQNGANKTRKTGRQTRSSTKKDEEDEDEGYEDEDMEEEEDASQEKANGNGKSSKRSNGAKNGPKKGETVSWNWGSGQPEGKVLDVKEEKATIKTKRGNEVSRNGDPEDPAVILDTGKSKAIKSAHELN